MDSNKFKIKYCRIAFIIAISISAILNPGPIKAQTPLVVTKKPENQLTMVFVHGLKGGILQDPEESEPCWLTLSTALGLRNCNLALPTRWLNNIQQKDNLRAVRVFKKFPIIPGLIEVDFYGDFIKAMENQGILVHSFNYDWRRDNFENRKKLNHFIEQLTQNTERKPVVIAHSMGGMLVLSLYNQAPHLFHSVVLVGTPLQGAVGFLNDTHIGTDVGINSKLLTPKDYSTFPSQFSFYPLDGQGLIDHKGQPISMDFYSVEHWQQQRLGPFSYPSQPDHDYKIFLEKTLQHAKRFKQSLKVPEHQQLTNFLVVIGHGTPTIATLMKGGPQSVRGWDVNTPARKDGDGRVVAEHARPQGELQYQVYESTFKHTELLQDPELQKRIVQLIDQ